MAALPDSVRPSTLRAPHVLAALGGLAYAAAVFSWLRSNGLHFSSSDPVTVAVGLGYALGGLFVMAAVPLYLLARFSLITPVLATGWMFSNTVYQHLYGTHLHPLSSYLIVWPLLFGMSLIPGGVEALVRLWTGQVVRPVRAPAAGVTRGG